MICCIMAGEPLSAALDKGNAMTIHRARIAAPLLAAALGAAPAAAQSRDEAAHREEDIVVLGTGSARDAALGSDLVTRRMSPSSRSLERDLLVANGTYRLSDALDLFSGVSQQNNRGGFIDNFAIRGFLGTPDGGAEYYVDGFLGNRGLAPPRDPATTERIEVLKGPSGAVFGDIDPAGRVNIVSKTPRFAAAAQAVLLAGSFGTRRAELDVTGPLSAALAARIVVAAEEGDGYRDFVGLSRHVVSPSITWIPAADTRLTLLAEHVSFASAFDRGIPAIGGDPLALPRSRFFGEPGDGDHRARNTRVQLTGERELGGEWRVTGGAAWRRSTLTGFSSDPSRLVDGRTLWRQRRERGYAAEDLAARVELSGRVEAGGTHHVAIGAKVATLDYLELLRRRNPTAAAPYAIDVFAPVYGGAAPALLPFTDQRERRRALTLYAQDMVDVTDRLTLSGGVRVEPFRQRLRRNLTGQTSERTGAPATFRAGARYRLGAALALHANWGESFLQNAGTGRPPRPDAPGPSFAPEQAHGWEVGATGRWRGVDIAATWFDIEKRNILTNDPLDPNFLAPVGSLRSRGVELDAAIRLAGRWQVVANYAFVDARADDSAFATADVLNVARHSGTVLAVARFPTHRGGDWSVSAGATYVGDRAGAIDASGLRLPGYVKAKLAGEVGLSAALTLRAEADNLFDTAYAMSSYSPLWTFPGAPRTVRVSLRLSI